MNDLKLRQTESVDIIALISDDDDDDNDEAVTLAASACAPESSSNCTENSSKSNKPQTLVISDVDDNYSSSTIRSLSSTLSSSHHSLDEEAEMNADEADEEDENENENETKNLPKANENLLHVQNFLKSFHVDATTTAVATATSTIGGIEKSSSKNPIPNFNNVMSSTNEKAKNTLFDEAVVSTTTATLSSIPTQKKETISSNYSELRSWRNKLKDTKVTSSSSERAIAQQHKNLELQCATSASKTTTTTKTASSTPTAKSQKFTISTKFLHKQRNKLKSSNTLSTQPFSSSSAAMRNIEVTSNGMTETKQQQQQPVMNSQHIRHLDDSIAKFKDFSIDSLLKHGN